MKRKTAFLSKTGYILLTLSLLLACVEPYVPVGLNLEGEVLVVEANLTDQPEVQFVRLTRSLAKPFNEFVEEPLTGASVTVRVNGVPQTLREASPGRYELPAGFVGKVGERFQLQFSTPAGQRYESGVETMQRVSKLEKAYDRFDAQAIVNAERTAFTPANLIYIDTEDPADTRNFYRWTWTLWERQDYCASCQRSVLNGTRCGQNGFVANNPEPPFWYDYYCLPRCWDLLFSSEINVFSDQYSNGRTIVGRLAGTIPYYEARGALVEIRQQALTPEAYRYYQLFASQTQANGGLADTPPAPLIGNVRNLDNADEIVSGYFAAGAVSKLRYWLDRQNASGVPIGLFFTQNGGRFAVPEPYSRTPFESRPPTAVCLPGDTRTPNRPEGWLGP